jgi:hypothetical protein
MSLTIISSASGCWSSVWCLYWYIGNLCYLHTCRKHHLFATYSLLCTYVIFSHFLPFCFSFLSFFLFLKNFLGPMVPQPIILCSPDADLHFIIIDNFKQTHPNIVFIHEWVSVLKTCLLI